MPAPRLRRRFREDALPRQDPRAPLRHCDQRGRSYALGVKSGLTHARPGGDRLRSSRVNPADQFLCICPPRRDSIQEPILDGRAALTTEALGRSSAQYSFYVPWRTSHPGKALSRARPESSPTLSPAERNRRGVQRGRNPGLLTAEGSTTPGPECWIHQRNVGGHRPSPASHHPTPAHGTPSCARLGTRHHPFTTVSGRSPRRPAMKCAVTGTSNGRQAVVPALRSGHKPSRRPGPHVVRRYGRGDRCLRRIPC
jgi:hypothetical protein